MWKKYSELSPAARWFILLVYEISESLIRQKRLLLQVKVLNGHIANVASF
jgi:hypothetical protein